jgi:hypothetical protein
VLSLETNLGTAVCGQFQVLSRSPQAEADECPQMPEEG